MRIAIGCDHIVIDMKNELIKYLKSQGHTIIDFGTYDKTRTHYPMYGRAVAINVVSQKVDLGVVLCGTGVGISNSASKVKGSRCLLVTNPILAKKAKEDYNANIISFGGRVIGVGTAIDIIDSFINAKYKGKNTDLIKMIDEKIISFKDSDNLFNEILVKWHNGFYTNGEKQKQVPLPKNN